MRAKALLTLLFLAGCGNPISSNVTDFQTRIREPFKQKPPEMVALQYVGFTERTHRTELKDFIGVDPVRTEWCAAFVNAVLSETGIPGSDTVSNHPLTARSFLNWGTKVKNPEPGDIVVFPRGNVTWQGHVGFYLRSQVIDGVEYYYILGGNQKNKVSIELYKANYAIGIRRHSLI